MKAARDFLHLLSIAIPPEDKDKPHTLHMSPFHLQLEMPRPLYLRINGLEYDLTEADFSMPADTLVKDIMPWYEVEHALARTKKKIYAVVSATDPSLPKTYLDVLRWSDMIIGAPELLENLLPLLEEAVERDPAKKTFLVPFPDALVRKVAPLILLERLFRPNDYCLGAEFRKVDDFQKNNYLRLVAFREVPRREVQARREEHPDCAECQDNPFTCSQHL